MKLCSVSLFLFQPVFAYRRFRLTRTGQDLWGSGLHDVVTDVIRGDLEVMYEGNEF